MNSRGEIDSFEANDWWQKIDDLATWGVIYRNQVLISIVLKFACREHGIVYVAENLTGCCLLSGEGRVIALIHAVSSG
jgi:hypothetical protein